jgi:hypothetical protein
MPETMQQTRDQRRPETAPIPETMMNKRHKTIDKRQETPRDKNPRERPDDRRQETVAAQRSEDQTPTRQGREQIISRSAIASYS